MSLHTSATVQRINQKEGDDCQLRAREKVDRVSPDKEATVFEKWPAWFRNKGDYRLSGMGLGFCCGDGWYDIIYQLCQQLEPMVAALGVGASDFQVVQVKEKFGGLRIYADGSNDEIEAAINLAGELIVLTCEVCGNAGRREEDATGWWKTLCASCRTSGQWQR